ncbi:hypothetical protein C8Q74DRAFT_1369719 [Fomes fomentarius]|nr:hypothetical protein C8Q74DRAFT_1369719 [Fomes fomentarius]
MADTNPTPPPSSKAIDAPLGRPYQYKPVRARPRPSPSVAFGFLLNFQCRLHWAKWYDELTYGPEHLSGKTPEEAHEALVDMEYAIRAILPSLIYSEFPDLYPLRNRLLPIVDGNPIVQYYIFVLRDDATWQGLKAPLTAEVIEGVRQRLGVGDVEPNWYPINYGAK